MSKAARSSLEAARMRSKPRDRAKQLPTKLTIEFDQLRRRPRRDSHGTCRLSGCTATFLANLRVMDFQAVSLPCEGTSRSVLNLN